MVLRHQVALELGPQLVPFITVIRGSTGRFYFFEGRPLFTSNTIDRSEIKGHGGASPGQYAGFRIGASMAQPLPILAQSCRVIVIPLLFVKPGILCIGPDPGFIAT